MPRIFKAVSIAVHAIVIGVVSTVQLFHVGTLPEPHTAIAFELPRITVGDVPLPPQPRRTTAAAPTVSPNAAPIVAPTSVRDETGLENAPTPSRQGVEGGVEGGGTVGDLGIGIVSPPPPPPPPPPAPPTTPIRVHSGMQAPVKTVNVDPVYPQIAQAAHKSGVVILEVIIDARGGVESVRVLRSISLLDQAAVDAVKQWRFSPARLNGQAVPVVMTVTVNFDLK